MLILFAQASNTFVIRLLRRKYVCYIPRWRNKRRYWIWSDHVIPGNSGMYC